MINLMDVRTECEFQKESIDDVVECSLSGLKFPDYPSPHFFCKKCKKSWKNRYPSPDDTKTWSMTLKYEVEFHRVLDFHRLNPQEIKVPDGEFTSLFDGSSNEILPSFGQMVKNFSSSMKSWVKAGFKTVSNQIFNERKAICEACNHWSKKKARCKICGCHQTKLHLATEQCPDKPPRWEKVET